MGEERVARLREVVADACWQTLPEGQRGAFVLRAIVETLGITAEGVDDLERTDGFDVEARALRTLLAAAHGGTDGR